MINYKRNIDIILILIVGFVLRFTISITHSYSNDELSAINRLRFDNFSDLITFGVKQGDMHPAGVQVFMKGWSLVFGTSELWMRLPFVLVGTASIWVLFLIGKRWFNRDVGLVAALLLAVLYFPIMHAEFARPYSPGLLVTLMVALFFHKVLFDEVTQKKDAIILGALFAAGMYIHYFTFLTLGVIGISGLFFLNKTNWKSYFTAAFIGVFLFLPHLPITLYQLGVESNEWISPPANNWLIQFLFYAFNSSWIIICLLAVLLIWARFTPTTVSFSKKEVVLLVGWFIGVYGIAHLISFTTPILKFPVALFILPFLLLLIGLVLSRLPKLKVIAAVVGLVIMGSTIIERQLYGNHHYAVFKEVSTKIVGWEDQYGAANIYSIFNLNNSSYLNYYAHQKDRTIELDRDLIAFGEDAQIREELMQQEEEFCIIGYAARVTLLQSLETVKEFYPVLVDYEQYNNGAVYLFRKGTTHTEKEQKLLTTFSTAQTNTWIYDAAYSSNKGYLLDENHPYGPDFIFMPDTLPLVETCYIKVEVDATIDWDGELTVAVSGMRNNEPLMHRSEPFWLGQDLEKMLQTSTNKKGYFAFKLPPYIKAKDQLKISLWNRSNSSIYIQSIRIYLIPNKWN